MSRSTQPRRKHKPTQIVGLAALGVAALALVLWLRHGAARGVGDEAARQPLDPPLDAASEEVLTAAEGVPILCYHYFRPTFAAGYTARVFGAVLLNLPTLGMRDFWTIPIGEFERHLRLFREHGIHVITLDEIAQAIESGREPPRPAVVLTIDDADESVYTLAYPALRRHGLRAHLFVPSGEAGRSWNGLSLCNWAQLREMSDSGVILVESHTHNLHWKVETARGWQPAFLHPDRLPSPDEAALPEELLRAIATTTGSYRSVAADLGLSRQAIARETGRAPRFLAWPYGFASDALDSLAAAVGFTGTVSLKPYPWRENSPAWHIGRYAVTAKTTPDVLFGLLPGTSVARREPD